MTGGLDAWSGISGPDGPGQPTTWNLEAIEQIVCSFLGDPASPQVVADTAGRHVRLFGCFACLARLAAGQLAPESSHALSAGRLPPQDSKKTNETGLQMEALGTKNGGRAAGWASQVAAVIRALTAQGTAVHRMENEGNFPAFPPGVRGPCAVPASCSCRRRAIGWHTSFSGPTLQVLGRATCSATAGRREKTSVLPHVSLAIFRCRASVASNQAFGKLAITVCKPSRKLKTPCFACRLVADPANRESNELDRGSGLFLRGEA